MTQSGLVSLDEGSAPRPVIVYIYDGEMDPEKAVKVEKSMFTSDDLAIASKIIRFVRIDGTTIPKEARAQYAPKLPTFHLLDSRGNEMQKVVGAKSARVLLASLSKLYKTQFKGSLAGHIKRVDRHLVQCEKLEDMVFSASKRVQDIEKRLLKKDKPNTRRSLAKAKAKVKVLQKRLSTCLDQRAKVVAGVLNKKFKVAASSTN